ncbi:unnamed protein product [Acanthoscelides obtectus]|uniref:Uncharacterized protein n=1 Tax=Acanthoscelides obtectus TaxID=200917 RepID=A0A9P0L378_ACAOB|nr:unnamed protein product [Acanthoscelides obtectus]CAK1680897.1 hypothetical protein AOBTE_LOCUS32929 [Acanthoscelides obtectus]
MHNSRANKVNSHLEFDNFKSYGATYPVCDFFDNLGKLNCRVTNTKDMISPRTEAKWQQWYEEVESDVGSELYK